MRKHIATVEDPFRERIASKLRERTSKDQSGILQTRIFEEVKKHSAKIQESDEPSELFFRLCELIVDCQSLSVPDDSFRILVGHLLLEDGGSKAPLDEELREFTGLDQASFQLAKEKIDCNECISQSLNRQKAIAKSNLIAGKKIRAPSVEVDS